MTQELGMRVRKIQMRDENGGAASWSKMERDIQGYGMFGGSSLDVFGLPVPQWGGLVRGINGRGLWRGVEEGESGLL